MNSLDKLVRFLTFSAFYFCIVALLSLSGCQTTGLVLSSALQGMGQGLQAASQAPSDTVNCITTYRDQFGQQMRCQ